MRDVKELTNFDLFFFYGLVDLDVETESDIFLSVIQPKRTLFYDRREGSDVHSRENYPNGISMQVGLRYDIANSIAYRNSLVSDGSNNTKDRRVAVSQNSINIKQDGDNVDILVLYILFSDFKVPKTVSIPVGSL